MIRTKGEAGTGNVIEAVRHMKAIQSRIFRLQQKDEKEQEIYAREEEIDFTLLQKTLEAGRLPMVNFAAGGIATPADAAMMMQLGCDGVFVGSGIFKSGNPEKRASAIVEAVTHYNDPKKLAELSKNLGEPMVGIEIEILETRMAARGH